MRYLTSLLIFLPITVKDENAGWSFNMLMANQIDNNAGLMKLVAHNAISIHHKLQGVQYDETYKIDVMNDVKFVIMTVGLPIGSKYNTHPNTS